MPPIIKVSRLTKILLAKYAARLQEKLGRRVSLFGSTVDTLLVAVQFFGERPDTNAWITVYLNDKWSRAEGWIADSYALRIYMVAASMKGKMTFNRANCRHRARAARENLQYAKILQGRHPAYAMKWILSV